jgi:hypothetical protein
MLTKHSKSAIALRVETNQFACGTFSNTARGSLAEIHYGSIVWVQIALGQKVMSRDSILFYSPPLSITSSLKWYFSLVVRTCSFSSLQRRGYHGTCCENLVPQKTGKTANLKFIGDFRGSKPRHKRKTHYFDHRFAALRRTKISVLQHR